ncbi:hypothetical protein ACHAQH_006649 [Verticillium albo-atrum]
MAPAVLEPEIACCLPVKNSSNGVISTTIKEIPALNDAEVLQAPLPNPSLQVTADHRIKTVEAPVLAPKKGEVLLQIKATGVCGSDIHFWKSGRIGTLVVEGDCILGHEAAGIVIRVGEGVTNFVPGDRVAIEPGVPCGDCFLCLEGRYNLCEDVQFAGVYPYHGTLQRYKTHPAKWLYKLPDNISYAQGALLEPLSVVLHGIRTAGLELGTGAVICGAGPIGLIALAAARASGAHPLVITDIEPLRLAFAKELVPECITYRVNPALNAEGNGRAIRALFGTEAGGDSPAIEIISVKFATSLSHQASNLILSTSNNNTLFEYPYKLELDFHIRYHTDPLPVDVHLAILPHRIPAQSLFHQAPADEPDLQSYFLDQLSPLCYRDLDPCLRVHARLVMEQLSRHILTFCTRHLSPIFNVLASSGSFDLEPIPLVTNDIAMDEEFGHGFVPGQRIPRGRIMGDLQPVLPFEGAMDIELLERVFKGMRENGTITKFQPAWDLAVE